MGEIDRSDQGAQNLISKKLSEKSGLTHKAAYEMLRMILDTVMDELVILGRADIENFGVFFVRLKKAWKANDPRDHSPIMIPTRHVVKFRQFGRLKKAMIENTLTTPSTKSKRLKKRD